MNCYISNWTYEYAGNFNAVISVQHFISSLTIINLCNSFSNNSFDLARIKWKYSYGLFFYFIILKPLDLEQKFGIRIYKSILGS
jgi:hypothetical protein